MANYTTADIKALREKTGAGMLDVKKALDEADGDQAKALEIIRVKGLKGLAKREGRSTSDGLVAAEVVKTEDGQTGVLIELNSETDFVAKSEPFIELANQVLGAAAALASEDTALVLGSPLTSAKGTVQDQIDQVSAALGERIQLRRVGVVSGEHVEVYLHRTNKDLPPQVGVLVATDAKGAKVAHDIAMHIAAYSPTYLNREAVPPETVAAERRIAEETAVAEGKNEKAIPKIVEGRLNGFFKENVLLDQAFAKDPKTTVGKVAAEAGGVVDGFVRFRVGA
ncbi:MAG: translation elongation factor Ts [Bifidobacteriaceae bacterium]|jgi:elongation factor Ts|nr:translation elongation factor Ts [Bifidobacteriaceae bacterium]